MEFYKHESEMGIPGSLCIFINGLEKKILRQEKEKEFMRVLHGFLN